MPDLEASAMPREVSREEIAVEWCCGGHGTERGLLYNIAMVDAIVLAVALSMDAAAVATACGAAGAATAQTFRISWLFAVFHVAMCTTGWLVGVAAESWISAWDHWLVFGLLGVIGGKMLWSAFQPDAVTPPASWRTLVGLAIATSIDAIAAGVTLPLVDAPEVLTIGLVGGVVFVAVNAGARLGTSLGVRFGKAFQVAGGVAIIGIGVKTLATHTW